MADAATIAVLKDLLGYLIITVLMAAAVYRIIGGWLDETIRPLHGNVLARPYEWQDAVAAALLCSLLTSQLWAVEPEHAQLSQSAPSTSTAEQAISICLSSGFMLLMGLALLSFIRVFRNLDPGEMFGLRILGPKKALITAAIWIIPTFIVVTALSQISNDALAGIWHDLTPQTPVKIFQEAKSPIIHALLAFSAIIIAPLAEELLFRGYVYGVIKRYTDSYFAAAASALLFAIVHLHVGTLLPLFTLGVVLVTAYEITGSLLVPIFIHSLFNAISTALILAGYDS